MTSKSTTNSCAKIFKMMLDALNLRKAATPVFPSSLATRPHFNFNLNSNSKSNNLNNNKHFLLPTCLTPQAHYPATSTVASLMTLARLKSPTQPLAQKTQWDGPPPSII